MSTSLAEQLKKLQTASTSILLQDKKKPSLLFDPKEAANLDRETVFNIGKNGLEDLIKLSSKFAEFDSTLFATSSINLERSVHNVDVNKKLDAGIEKFLTLLSPYFLLNTAHKALEWLIYRFHIHQYNKDHFLMLILPYHETRMFVRALQIVDLSNRADKWNWLEPLQKPGVPLSSSTLVNRVASDNGFLKLLCNHVISSTVVYGNEAPCLSTLYAFYTMAIVGAIERAPEITQVQVNHLLPSLLTGFASSSVDFIAGNFMILTKLTCKTHLNPETMEHLFLKSLKNPILKYELMLFIFFIYETMNLTGVSDKLVRQFAQQSWLCDEIIKIRKTDIQITKFLIPLFTTGIKCVLKNPEENDEIKNMIINIFQRIAFDDNEVLEILKTTFKPPPKLEEKSSTASREFLLKLSDFLETKYAIPFDRYIKQLMKTSETDGESKLTLQFLMTWHSSAQIAKASITILDRLNHYSPEQRILALDALSENAVEIYEGLEEMVIKSLLERFNDEDVNVVGKLLSFPITRLKSLFPTDILVDHLMILLSQCHTEKKYVLALPALKLLLELCKDGNDTSIFIATLPYLFPSRVEEVQVAQEVLESEFARQNKYLQMVRNEVTNYNDGEAIGSMAFHHILNCELLPQTENILTTMKLTHNGDATSLFFNLILLGSVCRVPMGSLSPRIAGEVIEMTAKMISQYPHVGVLDKCNQITADKIQSALKLTSKGILPVQVGTYVLEMVHRRLDITSYLPLDFENTPEQAQLILRLLEIFFHGINHPKQNAHYSWCLKIFFQRHFKSSREMLQFLSQFFIEPVRADTSMHCLCIARVILEDNLSTASSSSSINWIFEDNIFMTNILIALSRPHDACRQIALEILKKISQICNNINKTNGCAVLVVELCKKSTEISMDHEQLSLFLYNIQSPDPDVSRLLKKKNQRGKLQEARKFLFNCLTSTSMPIHIVAQLAQVLTYVNGPEILQDVAPMGVQLAQQQEIKPFAKMALKNILQRFNSTTVAALRHNDVWELFTAAITQYCLEIEMENGGKTLSPSVILMKQIDDAFFDNCDLQLQGKILAKLVDIVTECESSSIVTVAIKTVRRLTIDAQLVVDELKMMKTAKLPPTNTGSSTKARRSRQAVLLHPEIINTREWKRGITILEFIQQADNIRREELLVPVLFDLLRTCLSFAEQSPMEYTNQLLLSTIYHLSVKRVVIPDPHLQVDLISQCVRLSHNPQTHHHALLVLVELFKIANIEMAMHNIMPIFTFMGSSVLRQDDAYSIQIISKTIETIVPIVNSMAKDETLVCCILRLFIVSLPDIPEHRRIPLFVKLLSLLENHLHLFYLLTFESIVLREDKNLQSQRLTFCQTMCQEFSPKVLLKVCVKLLDFVENLPTIIEDQQEIEFTKEYIFDVRNNTPKQLRHYRYTIVQFLSGFLSSAEFVDRVALLTDEEITAIKSLYDKLIIKTVLLIQSTSKIAANVNNDEKSMGKYWNVLLHKMYNILEGINALLPNEIFVKTVKKLLNHDLLMVRRKILELINIRLQQRKFGKDDCENLLQLISPLIKIISIHGKMLSHEMEIIQQTALITLKLLTKILAADYPDKFQAVLELTTDLLRNKTGPILGSVVLCVAELVSTMKTRAIPHLNKYVPPMIELLQAHNFQESPDVVIISITSAMQKIVESVGNFLSLYLHDLMLQLCRLSSLYTTTEQPKMSLLKSRLEATSVKLASCIPLRVLLPAVTRTWTNLTKKRSFQCIPPLLSLLSQSITNTVSSDLQASTADLGNFFLQVLQFREEYSDASDDTVGSIESSASQALVALVLKLSENTFRPLYYKVYDWAARTGSEHKHRNITFFRLSATIAECLKSLFIPFAGHTVKHAAMLLQQNNLAITSEASENTLDDEKNRVELVEAILTTFHRIFIYDAHSFVTLETFETLAQPIIDQIENIMSTNEEFQERAQKLIVPCIASFAGAIQDDSLHKQLVYQILLKTRHSEAQVRRIALSALVEIVCKLGEDFMPLLPETIPFLAELLEDDDEETEKSAQNSVRTLEDVLGEPLQKYF